MKHFEIKVITILSNCPNFFYYFILIAKYILENKVEKFPEDETKSVTSEYITVPEGIEPAENAGKSEIMSGDESESESEFEHEINTFENMCKVETSPVVASKRPLRKRFLAKLLTL